MERGCNMEEEELETDAKPGVTDPPRDEVFRTQGKEPFLTHEHEDGSVTRVRITNTPGHTPNIQIGGNNVMIVGGASSYQESKVSSKKKKSSHRQPREVPNRPLSDQDIDTVSSDIGKHYRRLARQLGLTDIQIEQVEMDYKAEGSYEVAYQILRKWQKMGAASLATLYKALHSIDRTDVCDKLSDGS